ncbi:phosphoenolpyruvate carboxylase [Candidatus Woesearchaeota archaeon]|nr:phosphoenolpyruvate carboxylase [Candidatus Woesearchaeota archaeon]
MMWIPRTMSTQHPDNILIPSFAANHVLDYNDEIKEAYQVFSHLDCHEQLFDYEGKEADNFIIKRLVSEYGDYFKQNKIGKEKIISFRIPNAGIEKAEAKLVVEILQSIPRYFDTAQEFYHDGTIPVSEVYVPMVTNAKDTILVHEYYKKFVAGLQNQTIAKGIKLADWIGNFKPETVKVTPLVEDMNSMLMVDKIVEEHLAATKEEYKRVWLARSDPAINYSSLGAVILNKIAFQKLFALEQKISTEIYPIIGCGSAPFRGNLKPDTVLQLMKGYPSVQTFTIQSSFKYDNPTNKVKDAIELLNNGKKKPPMYVEEDKALAILAKVAAKYKQHIRELAPLINGIAEHVPNRRKRKLHIGLFGYSRSEGEITLPRAIKFCAALYSVGLPPEVLGLSALTEKEHQYIETFYPHFKADIEDALQFLNRDNIQKLNPSIAKEIEKALPVFDVKTNEEHLALSAKVMNDYAHNKQNELFSNISAAAQIRGFLG